MSDVEQILLGIDLGTSRTAVMTNQGTKSIMASVVGYPRDLIGVKLLGRYRLMSTSLDSESCAEGEEVEKELKTVDFVLVCYKLVKKWEQFYVDEVETVHDGEVMCKFPQKKSGDGLFFVYPDQAVIDRTAATDIILHLGKPKQSGSSGRGQKAISFGVDLSKYSVM